MSESEHTKNRTENPFPWAPLRSTHLWTQAICTLSRDVTGCWFLPPPETSQDQWSDEAAGIKKIWLLHLLQDMFMLLPIYFLLLIIY